MDLFSLNIWPIYDGKFVNSIKTTMTQGFVFEFCIGIVTALLVFELKGWFQHSFTLT